MTEARERFQAKEKELETRFSDREKSLDVGVAHRKTQLDEREAELDKRLEDVNREESKVERRRTIKDLIEQLDSSNDKFRFELTSTTQSKYWPVFSASVVLLVILGGVAAYFTYQDVANADTASWMWIRSTTLTIGFVVAFGVFVKWLNSWFQQHAAEEFRLKRLLLDVRRANLLIETALEWEKDSDAELPNELLATLSHNLFRDTSSGHEEVPPVETLASALLGAAARMELELAGNKVVLDRKSMRTLKKHATNGQAE
ncbi:MAG: hypothetical protein WBC44_17855 [Planctomycetaceae bacterium]